MSRSSCPSSPSAAERLGQGKRAASRLQGHHKAVVVLLLLVGVGRAMGLLHRRRVVRARPAECWPSMASVWPPCCAAACA